MLHIKEKTYIVLINTTNAIYNNKVIKTSMTQIHISIPRFANNSNRPFDIIHEY